METGITGTIACKTAGITYRQLDYWATTNLVVPSISNGIGSGSQRLYSFKDIIVLKVVKSLLNTGVSLQQIRKAVNFLLSKGIKDFAQITLISDGATIYECKSPEQIYDLMAGGQGVFGIALNSICKQVQTNLKKLPDYSQSNLTETLVDSKLKAM
jgi:DNA-binding transcriptional MerR regulator